MQDPPSVHARPTDHVILDGEGDAPALTVGGRTMSYSDLRERAGRIAAALGQHHLEAGARVASWLPKTVESCLLPLAAARAGLVHVPINPALKRRQVAHILADAEALLLVTSRERAGLLEPVDMPAGCTIVLDDELGSAGILPPSTADPAGLAALLYTSGSTGRPKGVMLSHANLWLGAVSVRSFLRLDAESRTLCLLPLAFDYGQNQLLATWAAGGHALALDFLTAGTAISAASRLRANTVGGVPSLWADLVDARWPDELRHSMRCLTNSGGHLPTALVRRLRNLFPEAALHLMYGLTEAFRASSLDPALVDSAPDAVGTPIPYAELFVLDGGGRECAPGEEGELVQAGPLVAGGYWRDAERTAERFREAPGASRWGGRAVWSGDTAVRGADGLLRIVGRRDALIKVAGHRISPTEIEEEAVASGAAREAVAIGVPDDRRGATIRLFVRGDATAEPALRAHLKASLPAYMQPDVVSWCDRFPLTPNGKVDRAALAREAEA